MPARATTVSLLHHRCGILFSLLIAIVLQGLAAMHAKADPTLTVRDGGALGGNQLWLVEVAPDPTLFGDTPEGFGGSLAVELDFQILDSEVVSVTKNDAAWPIDNPGFNPFASAMSSGVTFDTATAFVALGSDLFSTADPVEVVTIETLGVGLGTLQWGGNLAAPPNIEAYETARIAQAGVKFNGYMGMASVDAQLTGDYNGNATVEQADLDLVLLNWGQATPPVPPAWVNDLPDGTIDQAELDGVLLNWGNSALGAATVPEPATASLLLLCCALFAARPRRG
jgi:hypothetical protein